jgi:hypothetical protein
VFTGSLKKLIQGTFCWVFCSNLKKPSVMDDELAHVATSFAEKIFSIIILVGEESSIIPCSAVGSRSLEVLKGRLVGRRESN